MIELSDTIAAISTPPGRGGIGVVRISGLEARQVAEALLHFHGAAWQPRHATLADLLGPEQKAIDQVVVTWFPAPHSYTGEDVVELSCHGSPVVLGYALDALCRAGARLAEPGEFTLRAYLRARLDLPQAEAVRNLIEATTLYQARVAAQQVSGSVSRRVQPLKDQLLELIALLEAGIDFADDDLPVAPQSELARRLDPLRHGVHELVDSWAWGKLVVSGFTLAIVGKPNAGKSSLFNRLLEQDRAIVTEFPGTTRDTVSETASILGLPVRLVDTAGIRQSQDLVESLGVERSFQAMADADVTLLVLDASRPLEASDHDLIARTEGLPRLLIANKSDLPLMANLPDGALPVSAITGEGVEVLREKIVEAVGGSPVERETGFLTSIRQRTHLAAAAEALDRAAVAIEENIPHEMLLLDLYSALHEIDALTGATSIEDILHRIFATFCIGK